MTKIREIEEKIAELESIKTQISRSEGKLESAMQALSELGYESTEVALEKLEQLESTITRRENKLVKEVETFLRDYDAILKRN